MIRILIITLLSAQFLLSQMPHDFSFVKYDLDQGHTNHILRDSEGYIWLSTQDGLSQYNGSKFKQYNKELDDPGSLSNNYVWLTFEDNSNRLWVGTFGSGLDLFDKRKQTFKNFKVEGSYLNTEQANSVRAIVQMNQGIIAVGTDDGLHLFDVESERFITDSLFINNQRASNLVHVQFMEKLDSDRVIVSGENGCYVVNIKEKQIKSLDLDQYTHDKLKSVYKSQNHFYVSYPSGVFQLDHELNIINKYPILDGVLISGLTEISENLIGIISVQGFFTLDISTGEVYHYGEKNEKQTGLTDRILYHICEIEKDLFWIGGKTGFFEFSAVANRFHVIEDEHLCEAPVLGMTEDDQGNLWVATRKGLSRIKNFNQARSEWEYFCYNKSNTPALRNNYMLNVMLIDGELWLGYRRLGLARFALTLNDNIEILDVPPKLDTLTQNHSVCDMMKDSRNNIWIGTSGNGVIRWDATTKDFIHFNYQAGDSLTLSHPYVFDIKEMNNDEIAFATANGGLCIYNYSTDNFRSYQHNENRNNSLSNNFVMDIYPENKGVWVSTSGGLNYLDSTQNFTSWHKKDGLPNDVIYGMVCVDTLCWISCNKGIVNIIKKDNDQLDFRTYNKQDGIQGNEHNQFSYYKSRSDKILFGGKNGMTYFNPYEIKNNQIQATPVISEFHLFNENAGDWLEQAIDYTQEITLRHDQNFISFDLAALSFRTPQNNCFKYRMLGLSDQWIDLSTRNYISFNGLPPGNYWLEIKAANNDRVWSDKVRRLNIIVLKPIWKRWYAIMAYLIILMGIAYAWYRSRLRTFEDIQKAKEEERIRIRERSARDFHDEAGAYITKLALISELGKRNINNEKELRNLFQKLQANVESLRLGMKDFIWVIDPSNDSLYNTLIHIKTFALDALELLDVKLNMPPIDPHFKSIEVNGEQRRQIFLIIKEAISNAIKHSGCSEIKILAEAREEHRIFMTVIDNGKGFDVKEKFGHGYGLQNMRKRARKLDANFNVECKEGHYTRIAFDFEQALKK